MALKMVNMVNFMCVYFATIKPQKTINEVHQGKRQPLRRCVLDWRWVPFHSIGGIWGAIVLRSLRANTSQDCIEIDTDS